jgi:hypothetical protein
VTALDAARSMARAGVRVHPTRKKAPILRAPLEAATTDEATIAAWFETPDVLPGYYPGQNALVVVDLDEKNGVSGALSLREAGHELPKTWSYATPSGGRHHVYRVPEGIELAPRDGFLPGVDLRAGNGNVVCYAKTVRAERMVAAPDWVLAGTAPTSERTRRHGAHEATVDEFIARLRGGKASKKTRRLARGVEFPVGGAHDAMLAVVATLVKAGRNGSPGIADLLEETRARYAAGGSPDRPRDWEKALAGSVREFGLPPVSFPLTKAERSRLAERHRAPKTVPVSLSACHDTFRGWLGIDYDLQALNAVLAAAVVERMDGDPAWLLLISGSGNAKTETVQSLAGAGARIVSQIASAGALLSGTSKGERSANATGGLLHEIGSRGVMVLKDVTTILSMSREARAEVLAALREVHDGSWTRSVGTDGGRSIEWAGRLVVIGAVTTAWDRAHADTISAFGDRFVIVRMDSTTGRIAAGWKAISNTGSEEAMRAELSAAAAGVLAGADLSAPGPNGEETARILAAADLVTLARTAVDLDYRGNVVDAHAPEMPTRFSKQLAQVFRGGVAIGLSRTEALALAIRVARDSMPPLRLEILEDVAANPWTPLREVVKRVDKPRSTVDRQLQALHLLGLLTVDEEVATTGLALRETTTWRYTLADGIDVSSIAAAPTTKKEQNR